MRLIQIAVLAAWIVSAVGCSSPTPINGGSTLETRPEESDLHQNVRRGAAADMILRLEADEFFPAPDFTLLSSKGTYVSLSDYKGYVVFVNFWATWCPPCRIELPQLQTLYETYADQKFVVLGISVDRPFSPDAPAFARQLGLTFPILETTRKVNEAYGEFNAVPVTFVINREGLIVEIFLGTHGLALKTALLRLL